MMVLALFFINALFICLEADQSVHHYIIFELQNMAVSNSLIVILARQLIQLSCDKDMMYLCSALSQ